MKHITVKGSPKGEDNSDITNNDNSDITNIPVKKDIPILLEDSDQIVY